MRHAHSIADNIFDAIAIIVDKSGMVEHSPKTEEEWATVRVGGVTMAEGAYLLRSATWAPPGDENNSTGPDAVELSPAQITAKVEKDPVEWNARIEALRNVGLQVIDIVNRKATQELWDASENLDAACEACHRSDWYPGETRDYYGRLDRRMREHNYPTGTKLPEPEKVASGEPDDHAGREFGLPGDVHMQADEAHARCARDRVAGAIEEGREHPAVEPDADPPVGEHLYSSASAHRKAKFAVAFSGVAGQPSIPVVKPPPGRR